MDAVKAVGRAIKNSPMMVRKKVEAARGRNKLKEDWLNSNDAVMSGITFYVKYLGTIRVATAQGQGCTDQAVIKIIAHAKMRQSKGHKLQKLCLTVSSKSIALSDAATKVKRDELPIPRISFCTVDPNNDRVFAYICRNAETGELECHAFLCSKKSKAQAITLSVAQAFNIAYQTWQEAKARRAAQMEALKRATQEEAVEEKKASSEQAAQVTGNLVAVDAAQAAAPMNEQEVAQMADKFADWDMDADLDAEFSKLAQDRTAPHMLDIGGVDGFEDSFGEEVMQFQNGEQNADDLNAMPSHDDLIGM